MNTQPDLPKIKLQLSWRAYYKAFSEKHGGFPIIYKGRQLFADGWMYSLKDYAGPEWPPPKDLKELCTLQKVYWYTRWNRAKNELDMLRIRFAALKDLQSNKSATLQQVITTKNQDTNKVERNVADWSPQVFELTIAWLESEVESANNQILKLKDGNNDPSDNKEITNGQIQWHDE